MPSIYEIPRIHLLEVDKIDLTKEQEASRLIFVDKERLWDEYSNETELIKVCNKFFGDKGRNETNGLIHHFKEMKKWVVENNLEGLMLHGFRYTEILINRYTKEDMRTVVRLTVGSLTRTLIRDYFNPDELCKKIE